MKRLNLVYPLPLSCLDFIFRPHEDLRVCHSQPQKEKGKTELLAAYSMAAFHQVSEYQELRIVAPWYLPTDLVPLHLVEVGRRIAYLVEEFACATHKTSADAK